MKKLTSLLVLLAVPAGAQDARVYHASDTWPVEVSGRTCSMANALVREASNPLTVTYDSASGEVLLTVETSDISSGLESTGSLVLAMVFLDNGDIEHDDGWGSRNFGYTHENGVTRFATRFAGERPIRQILADLASSKHIGLLYRGQAISSTNLAGASGSVARLGDCARQALASN